MGVFQIWWWQSGLNVLDGLVSPSTARFYSTVDLQLNDDFHEGRIPEGATPQISQSVPEFFAGVELPQPSQFVLSNLDNLITTLKVSGGFKRGKKVIISKGFGSINQGLVTMDAAESYVEYRGVIDSASIGDQAIFSMMPADIDIFDREIPFEKTTTDLWPNAIDLDEDIPAMVTGTVKQIALALVLADESPEQYQYLIGRDSLTIDVVYRDRLALTEYTDTATGTSTSTVTLAAGDQESDDFYNKKFIEMDGVVRQITDYVGSTNIATVTPTGAWSAGAYTIREWKKITQVKNTVTYTLIEFARRQRDTSETMYQKDRMSADITGLTTERNPARYIETLLELFPDVALNSAGFTTAATAIDTEGNLFVDGALVTRKRVFDILEQVCHIGRLRLRLNDSGELYPVMDGTDSTVRGVFNYDDNIISIGTPEQLPLSQLWKTLELRYRLLYDEDDFRLTTARHDVNVSEGRIDQALNYELVFDKTTADKLCDYLAKRKNSFDESLTVTLNHEARGLELGQLINLSLNIPAKSDTYQIISKSLLAQGYAFTVIPYAAPVFSYGTGVLPSDPVTDSQQDNRFTSAAAVTSLAIATQALPKDFKAIATLSWVNPTSNFTDALALYKKTADSLFISAGVVSGDGDRIEFPIDAGVAYDYKVLSFNQFRDPLLLGVATLLNQTSDGTAATPSKPGTPTIAVSVRGFQGSLSSYSKPSNFLRFEWQYTNNGGTSQGGIFTSEGLIAPALIENGTGAVTRKVKVRAIGIQSDGTEVASAYSTLSSSITNELLLQDHILEDEVTRKASGGVRAQENKTSGDVLATVTFTARNRPVMITARATCVQPSAGTISCTFRIRRGGTQLEFFTVLDGSVVGFMLVAMDTVVDPTPGTGSVTYDLFLVSETTAVEYEERRISVVEFGV